MDVNGKLFGAVVEDGLRFQVFLINRTGTTYTSVVRRTGAWVSCDDELLQTSTSTKEIGQLPAGGMLEIDESDVYELDFTIWYELILTAADGAEKLVRCSIRKYGRVDDSQFVEEFGREVGVMKVE